MLINLNTSASGGLNAGPYVGPLGSEIPTGGDFPAWLLNDIDPAYPNRRYRLLVTAPSAGELYLSRVSSGYFKNAPAGTYTGPETVEKYDEDVGLVSTVDTTYSLTVGVAAVATVTGVSVSPASVILAGAATQQFSATVVGTNAPSQAVTWTASAGSISSSGLLTAPAANFSVQLITVTVTSTLNPAKSGTATVTIAALALPLPPIALTAGTPSVMQGVSRAGTLTAILVLINKPAPPSRTIRVGSRNRSVGV